MNSEVNAAEQKEKKVVKHLKEYNNNKESFLKEGDSQFLRFFQELFQKINRKNNPERLGLFFICLKSTFLRAL